FQRGCSMAVRSVRLLALVAAILVVGTVSEGQTPEPSSATSTQNGGSSTLSVTATAGTTTPHWPGLGEQTSTPVSASLQNPPAFASGPMYTWSVASATLSVDGASAQPAGGYYASFDN